MLDYIVVGLGLAGISFCETLGGEGKSFGVITDCSQQASRVAGGMYNPVILKRFSLAWKAKEQLGMAQGFYKSLEAKLGLELVHRLTVLRRFASVEEQNAWFEAQDRTGLDLFLSPGIVPNTNPMLEAPLGFGKVLHTGKVDTPQLVDAYASHLEGKGLLLREKFDYPALEIYDDHVVYGSLKAKQLVLACGYGLKKDPFFGYLPLNGTKGEMLLIKAPDYKEENVIKASVFTIPKGNDLYWVGATYKWQDKSNEPTEGARLELLKKLRTFLKCDYQVMDQVAGIRPTVVDRMPLVGRHPQHQNLYVLNGFGSRGVMIAPYASQQLYQFIENGRPLDPEMDIGRFTKKYYSGVPANL